LLGEEFIPAEAYIFEPLLQGKPCTLVPAQAVLDGIAILHQRFLDFLAHFLRVGSAQRCHLAIPPRAELLAKTLQPEESAQRIEMLGKARALIGYFRLLQELAPGLVREQGKGA